MFIKSLVIVGVLVIGYVSGASTQPRQERSLLNTFPFNDGEEGGHHGEHHGDHGDHGDHGEHHVEHHGVPLTPRNNEAGSGSASFADVASAELDKFGKRCIEKVEIIETTEYEDVVHCEHSYDKRCHTTYTTNYDSQQEEECDENYRKTCIIEYEQIAFNETIKICRTPLVKDCYKQGSVVCRTEYESECWTKQEEHDVIDDVVECKTVLEKKCEEVTSGYTTEEKCSEWPKEECSVTKKSVKKYTPITGCHKEPITFCAPRGCGVSEGLEVCHDKVQTIVQDAPKEKCTLEPQRTCKHVTKLVPILEPTQECVDVPKEVCTTSQANPKKVSKPVVKTWCYVPSPESGLE